MLLAKTLSTFEIWSWARCHPERICHSSRQCCTRRGSSWPLFFLASSLVGHCCSKIFPCDNSSPSWGNITLGCASVTSSCLAIIEESEGVIQSSGGATGRSEIIHLNVLRPTLRTAEWIPHLLA